MLFVPPGETHGRHTRRLPCALHVIQGSGVRAYDADGKEAARADVPTGDVMVFDMENGEFVTGAGGRRQSAAPAGSVTPDSRKGLGREAARTGTDPT